MSSGEPIELPRFVVSGETVIRDPDIDITAGFVIEEDGRSLVRPYDLHDKHMDMALEILEAAELVTDPVVISETYRGYFRETDQHVDGLTHEFYQGHTTLLDRKMALGHQGGSKLWLGRYSLSHDEHEEIQSVHDAIGAPGPLQPISMGSAAYANDGTTLWPGIGGRCPEAAWTAIAEAQMGTMIFRNGYDATPGSEPTDLYVHAGRTIGRPQGATHLRLVSLSRIESRA